MRSGHMCESVSHTNRDMNLNHRLTLNSCTFRPEPRFLEAPERLCNGLPDQSGEADQHRVTSEDVSRSLPPSPVEDEDDLMPEIQQAYRIFQSFLSEKHKAMTAPFWHPIGPGSQGDQAPDSEMCFKKMDDKFVNREYESITAFVADFRLMLENCYRFHGVHHWMSKQAQKLEIILEQKLTLLSRTLREKTTLAVTSGGRFGTEDEKVPAGMSSRRRSVPRNLAAITVGGSESIMVQALRLEELQRAKDEKRQRELERKEAEEVSAKDMEEWERSLLSLAEPWTVHNMWELPAIGHFLCLAQTALNLPEIVFYELERCLLMPRCSSFLSKVMTSLLCPMHKRLTVHRRPPLPYRKWEAELRRRVQGWYQAVGRSEDQVGRAEQLGLCHQFFWTVGEMNPLEEVPFHLLSFNQRVWLLKGLCDHVYETQKDVQDAVLGQPIHECRESILGYDAQDNAYIHFPHFCGADLRIYRQSPCLSMEFPLPPFHVKRSEEVPGSEVKEEMMEFDGVKIENINSDSTDVCMWNVQADSLHDREELYTEDSGDVQERSRQVKHLKEENEEESDIQPFFRVGDSCYKGKSPALNSHTSLLTVDVTQQNLREKRPCTECSEASTQHCSDCQIWNHVQPEIQQQRHNDFTEETTGMTYVKKKKRKKKREFSVRKTNTDKLNKKKRVKDRLLNRKKKKQKLRKAFDMKFVLMKRRAGSSLLPAEPSFQLVCSSLDDLRRLISQTEDELDELNSTKKRSGRLPHKRSTVKELHITLIRLLNELLPWEPKLVKAFQKNRARLKKECDDFKKHPEYKNFTREQIDTVNAEDGFCKDLSLSTETTGDLEDGEFNSGQTLKEDSETAEHINKFGDHKSRCLDHRTEIIMECSETGHFTRGSKRRHSLIKEELSTFKREKMDPESSLKKTTVETVSQDKTTTANTQPSERASVLSEPVRSFQGTFKPIQALLAKSVGNKVTLINHPQAAFMAQRPQDNMTASAPVSSVQPSATCSRPEPVSTVTPAMKSTSESTNPLVYNTEGGVGLLRKGGTSVKFSVQSISNEKPNKLTQVVFLPSNLLIQNTEIKGAQQSPKVSSVTIPSTNTYLSNVPGYTVTEDKVPVQPVSPQKDINDVRTPSVAVLPTLRTLPTSAVPKKTTEPKVALNISTTCTSTKPDAKQELRTVCIRDSQSILVTTRGGNTGVVKVQRSEKSGTDTLKPSPVFAISPQLQAFLVSKVSTSTTQTVTGAINARSLPAFSPVVNRVSSQSNNIIPFSSSAAVTGTLPSSILNQVSNNSSVFASPYLTKTLISDKSHLLSKSNDSVLVTVKEVQQNTLMKPSQQTVLLINPSSNITSPATKIPTTTSTGTMPGSRVMSIKHPSVCENSTLAIPKGVLTSNANVSTTSPALEALRVIPNLQASFGCTASGPVTNIQSISLPGSTSMILSTNKNMSPVSNNITPVIVTRALASSTSSGLQCGQPSNVVARINESGIGKSFLKAAGSVDGKTLFSTLGTGHMASSAVLSVVKQDTSKSTVLSALNNKPGLVVGSSNSDLSSSFSESLINKHTMLLSRKPQMISSLCTLPSTVNTTSVTSTAGLSHPPMLSNSIQTHTGNSSTSTTSVMTSGMRPNSSVQEKILINTTTPLAPGTQLLINNTKLLVPPQGLGPGSHVLFISSSSPGMASGQGVNSGLMPTPPRGQNASVIQGMKLVTPQQSLVRLPSPTRAKAGSSDRVHQQVNISTPPSPATVSQVTQPGLANVLRLPLFQPSDDKGHTVTPSQNTSSCPPESSVVCSLSQRHLLSTTSTLLLQTRLDNTPPQNQMASVAPPVKTVITQSAPVVTRPAMSSTMSRMQKLPVATVPPIGCPNISQATPVTTVPPSMNTVIKTPWQPMRALQTVGKPVVLCQQPQTQSTSAVQITSSNCTASKLLLSPDGAILSIVQASEPSNVQKTTNPMTTGVTLADDPLRKADIPDGFND